MGGNSISLVLLLLLFLFFKKNKNISTNNNGSCKSSLGCSHRCDKATNKCIPCTDAERLEYSQSGKTTLHNSYHGCQFGHLKSCEGVEYFPQGNYWQSGEYNPCFKG